MSREVLLKILDQARWAPSGDNTQPWRFEILADDRVVVHGHDTRDHVLYDFDGHPSHMAHGALLETMRIAASAHGLTADWDIQADAEARHPRYDVRLVSRPGLPIDPLAPYIEQRVVQRRPMKLRPLTDQQREELKAAVGKDFEVRLFETFAERKAIAGLLWRNARIRLTCREAFPVHQEIIEWGARYSEDRIPEQAVGVDPLTAKLMRWVMRDWRRVDFFNRYLMGTIPPRIQLDYLPALMCAAHVLIEPSKPLANLADWVKAGQAMQRFWLTATREGLHLQPEMTPVIFRWYARANRQFSADPVLFDQALELSVAIEREGGLSTETPLSFMCRVGVSAPPGSRSTRIGLNRLLTEIHE